MILLQQLGYLTEDVKDDMSHGKSGTDNTLFVKTQTGLQTAVAATNLALEDKTFTTSSVTVSHVIGISVGNSNTLQEYEVNNGTESYNRVVKGPIIKASPKEVTTIHTFDFELI